MTHTFSLASCTRQGKHLFQLHHSASNPSSLSFRRLSIASEYFSSSAGVETSTCFPVNLAMGSFEMSLLVSSRKGGDAASEINLQLFRTSRHGRREYFVHTDNVAEDIDMVSAYFLLERTSTCRLGSGNRNSRNRAAKLHCARWALAASHNNTNAHVPYICWVVQSFIFAALNTLPRTQRLRRRRGGFCFSS